MQNYKIAKEIANKLEKCLPLPSSNVKNSFEMNKLLKNFHVPSGYTLASLDATSLFTNMTLEQSLDSLYKRKDLINEKADMSFDDIVAGVKFLYYNYYFQFNYIVYQRFQGSPMGSPISSILANIVIEDLK